MTNETNKLTLEDLRKTHDRVLDAIEKTQKAADESIKARALEAYKLSLASLKLDHPMIVIALEDVPVEVSNITSAILTDNNTIWINPDWFTTKSEAELRHTVAFIGLSFIYCSIARGDAFSDLDHWRWTTACNLVINRALIDMGVGALPPEGAFITSISPQATSEEVYEILKGMTREEINKAIWPLIFKGEALAIDLDVTIQKMQTQEISSTPETE